MIMMKYILRYFMTLEMVRCCLCRIDVYMGRSSGERALYIFSHGMIDAVDPGVLEFGPIGDLSGKSEADLKQSFSAYMGTYTTFARGLGVLKEQLLRHCAKYGLVCPRTAEMETPMMYPPFLNNEWAVNMGYIKALLDPPREVRRARDDVADQFSRIEKYGLGDFMMMYDKSRYGDFTDLYDGWLNDVGGQHPRVKRILQPKDEVIKFNLDLARRTLSGEEAGRMSASRRAKCTSAIKHDKVAYRLAKRSSVPTSLPVPRPNGSARFGEMSATAAGIAEVSPPGAAGVGSASGVSSASARAGASDTMSDGDKKPAAVTGKRTREVNQGLLDKVSYVHCLVRDGYITTTDGVVSHFLE